MKMKIERETQSNLRLAISWYQWNIISPKEEDDNSYHEIHSKQKKWYIYIYMKIARETIKYEIGNLKISMKYYIAKRRRRYFISWDTSKTAKKIYIYIYMKMKIERETQSNLRLAISWHQGNIISPKKKEDDIAYHEIHSNQQKWYIYIIMKIERDTIKFEIGNFKILIKYYIVKKRRRYFISWDTSKISKMIYIYIYDNEDWERDH